MDTAQRRALFSKPYGAPGPSEAQWRELYADDVLFSDPTQEREGKICDHRDHFDVVGPASGRCPYWAASRAGCTGGSWAEGRSPPKPCTP